MGVGLIALAAAAAQPASPPVPAPPPFRAVPIKPPPPPQPAIARFEAEAPRCDGAEVRPTVREEPFPVPLTAGRQGLPGGGRVTVRFRIDPMGRPLGIAVERGSPSLDISDVAPALAAWRFPAGRERSSCTIAFRAVVEPVATAEPATLYRFLALHPSTRRYTPPGIGTAAFERIRPAGSTCRPRPPIRVEVYPPFETIVLPPGTTGYSFMTYDIDAAGRARNVRLVSSSGHARLDSESVRATGAFRFAPGARTGCTQYFYRLGTPMAPPPPPDEDAYQPAGATCPADSPEWAQMPRLVFPVPFNRRGIEGWAVVRYDVGPNGETRNVEAVDYAPAAEFAEQAARIVDEGRKPADGRGYSGCMERVIFRLPQAGTPPEEG
jgi:TonB family protein